MRPIKPLTIQLDVEVGRADRPFFTTSEKNYHAINGRIQYKAGNVLLSAMSKTFYNTNSVNLFAHSARSRTIGFDASWTASGWLTLDAGYSKLHLDTSTGLAYFLPGNLIENNRVYFSNLHAGNFGARIAIRKRADLYLGYSIVKDTGWWPRSAFTDTARERSAGAVYVLGRPDVSPILPVSARAPVHPSYGQSPMERWLPVLRLSRTSSVNRSKLSGTHRLYKPTMEFLKNRR